MNDPRMDWEADEFDAEDTAEWLSSGRAGNRDMVIRRLNKFSGAPDPIKHEIANTIAECEWEVVQDLGTRPKTRQFVRVAEAADILAFFAAKDDGYSFSDPKNHARLVRLHPPCV